MNRVIKFRIWDSYNKRFFTKENRNGCSIDDGMEYQDEVNTVFDCFFNSLSILQGRGGWDNGRFIIQQFTGRKDKNGKEIYEGDIVNGKIPFDNIKNQVVEYRPQKAVFVLSKWGTYLMDVGKLEIIGNIFENPSLIN